MVVYVYLVDMLKLQGIRKWKLRFIRCCILVWVFPGLFHLENTREGFLKWHAFLTRYVHISHVDDWRHSVCIRCLLFYYSCVNLQILLLYFMCNHFDVQKRFTSEILQDDKIDDYEIATISTISIPDRFCFYCHQFKCKFCKITKSWHVSFFERSTKNAKSYNFQRKQIKKTPYLHANFALEKKASKGVISFKANATKGKYLQSSTILS